MIHYLQFRVSRGQHHVDAIRKGISDVIPLETLDMFSAAELQQMWCAEIAPIDMEDWKNHIHVREDVAEQSAQFFLQYLDNASDKLRRDV